jgi:hypothetical protein
MKIVLLLALVAVVAAGCQASPRAPATKRTASNEQFDEAYLRNVFIPSYASESSRSALSNAVTQLQAYLAEWRAFMAQVETGTIAVTQVEGGWQSYQKERDCWIYAGYAGRLGPVVDFQKHRNQDPYPLVYGLSFYTNGYLRSASSLKDGFEFDEQGRIKSYYQR